MPLLRNGQWADNNPWTLLEDDDALPIQSDSKTPLLCSLKRFIELNSLRQPHSVSGVWLTPDDDVMRLAGHLDHLQLVVIDFPAYTDGRGYTQARLLRKHLGFSGEVRASGDVRPDQMVFMVRSGIDTFAFPEQPDEALVQNVLQRFTVNYQPSYALPIAG